MLSVLMQYHWFVKIPFESLHYVVRSYAISLVCFVLWRVPLGVCANLQWLMNYTLTDGSSFLSLVFLLTLVLVGHMYDASTCDTCATTGNEFLLMSPCCWRALSHSVFGRVA